MVQTRLPEWEVRAMEQHATFHSNVRIIPDYCFTAEGRSSLPTTMSNGFARLPNLTRAGW